MITDIQLAQATGCQLITADAWLPWINEALYAFDIDTLPRTAAFLAQISHESGGLHFVRELWGPTPEQLRYEGRADLGNLRSGDGFRYRGRGLIQITGRANYARTRDGLRLRGLQCPDFEAEPEKLELPHWAALSAGLYWASHGLNELADAGDFVRIGRAINRGDADSRHPANGEEQRVSLWETAKEVLA